MGLFNGAHIIVVTAGIEAEMKDKDFASKVMECLRRHKTGDWGDCCKKDKKTNNQAIKLKNRIMSVYTIGDVKIWIITEADRSVTTILFPIEY